MEPEPSIHLFVASAGRGTRLRPVTNRFPKPLLPLAGIPLIERLLYSVQSALKIQDFAMNLHHQPEVFQDWAQKLASDLLRPTFFYEEQLLGTGGAIAHARDFFMQGTCLLINGDILTDIDWQAFAEHHQRSGNRVTLAVQDRSHERRVGVDAEGKLLCIDPEMKNPGVHRWMGYACAAIYEPEFLNHLPEGESHVPPFWVEAAEKTGKVGTYDIGSSPWIDLGNVNSYAEGVFACLKGSKNFYAEPLKIPWDTQISGVCVIEKNVTIGSNVELCDTLLLPGAHIQNGEKLRSKLVGPDFCESFSLPATAPAPKTDPTILSGSDRVYRHVANGLLLEYTASETRIERQISLTQSLRKNGPPVPKVISHNPSKRQLLLEDLGDVSLRSWCQSHSGEERILMLKRVLNTLIDFQWADVARSPYPQDKPFDQTVLLWESSYFMERCVYRLFDLHEFCKPREKNLRHEFEQLADAVAGLPRHLMHRDFQSSNVMIHQGKPWFIDFQGAHHGPCFYDAASMIGDPYLHLPQSLRRDLEQYYLLRVSDRLALTPEASHNALLRCGIQRHMQALGAYGFLSAIRGKEEFLSYVSPALDILHEEVSGLKTQLPTLNELIEKMRGLPHE